MISSTEAALLMSKWKSESKRVRTFFIAQDKSVNLRLTASVSDFRIGTERLKGFKPLCGIFQVFAPE